MEQENGTMTVEEQAYWDGMPEDSPESLSPSDKLVQALLEMRVGTIMAIKAHALDEDLGDGVNLCLEDGILAGQLNATVAALTLAVEYLELSPRHQYVTKHVLKKGNLPEY